MKINPKLERSNGTKLELQESLTTSQYCPPGQTAAIRKLSSFCLFLCIVFDFRTYIQWYGETEPKKPFYQSYPGIFTDIATHDLLILDPQLTSLCPKRRNTHTSYINQEETGVTSGRLALLPKWPGRLQISRESAMNRLHSIKNSQSILNLYNRSS